MGIPINQCEKHCGVRTRVKPSSPPPGLGAIRNPVVSSAILALNLRDRRRWFELFSGKPGFSDDGIPRDLVKWCEEELFGPSRAYLISIDKAEDGGLTFYARKELRLMEEFTVDLELVGISADGVRFRVRNTFHNAAKEVAASVTSEGVWFDLERRQP